MNNNKKSKRVLPLLLAVLLLISAGAYGTRAFFTDEEELKTSINIETGTIDIKAPEEIDWKYTPNVNANVLTEYNINSKLKINNNVISDLEINDNLGSEITISNARPGDAFSMVVVVENNSTLDMLISETFTAPSYNDGLYSFEFNRVLGVVTNTDPNPIDGFTLVKAGEAIQYEFKITVDDLAANAFNTEALTALAFSNITLEAKQPNAN